MDEQERVYLPLTDEEVDEISDLWDQTTPGPWLFKSWNSGRSNCEGYSLMLPSDRPSKECLHWGVHIEEHGDYEDGSQARKDAAAIARSRVDVPRMVATIRIMRRSLVHGELVAQQQRGLGEEVVQAAQEWYEAVQRERYQALHGTWYRGRQARQDVTRAEDRLEGAVLALKEHDGAQTDKA